MKQIKSFTLAEVLITLVVIGIIAAITVPLIMTNHRKTETAARLKKFYSTMSNAIRLSETEQGIPSQEWGNVYKPEEEKEWLEKYILNYLVYSKVETLGDDSAYYESLAADISGYSLITEEEVIIYLNDGSAFFPAEGSSYIGYDVNGNKGPNRWGRDVFLFHIETDYTCTTQTVPHFNFRECISPGLSRTDLISNCQKRKDHHYCTRLIASDGWEIKSDYPLKI